MAKRDRAYHRSPAAHDANCPRLPWKTTSNLVPEMAIDYELSRRGWLPVPARLRLCLGPCADFFWQHRVHYSATLFQVLVGQHQCWTNATDKGCSDMVNSFRARALIVDDDLANLNTTLGRAAEGLARSLEQRDVDVVRAFSFEDGEAVVVADAAIQAVLLNWDLGTDDEGSHRQAMELLEKVARASRGSTGIPLGRAANRDEDDHDRSCRNSG